MLVELIEPYFTIIIDNKRKKGPDTGFSTTKYSSSTIGSVNTCTAIGKEAQFKEKMKLVVYRSYKIKRLVERSI